MDPRALVSAALSSPKGGGVLKLIVQRLPGHGRATPEAARLSEEKGLEGDRWSLKPGADRSSQVSLINARFIEAAGGAGRMALAGDNLVVDLDLSEANLPAGTRLEAGEALLEVTAHPHTGCAYFERCYGRETLALLESPEGKSLRLRGVYARVVRGGEIRVGQALKRVP